MTGSARTGAAGLRRWCRSSARRCRARHARCWMQAETLRRENPSAHVRADSEDHRGGQRRAGPVAEHDRAASAQARAHARGAVAGARGVRALRGRARRTSCGSPTACTARDRGHARDPVRGPGRPFAAGGRRAVLRTRSRPCGWRAVLRDRVPGARPSRPPVLLTTAQPYAIRQLARGSAPCSGIRLMHSTPGRPQGRGKIERFFRTLREEAARRARRAGEPPGLAELERMLQAWIERVYHRRVHSETKVTPLARFSGFMPRVSDRSGAARGVSVVRRRGL